MDLITANKQRCNANGSLPVAIILPLACFFMLCSVCLPRIDAQDPVFSQLNMLPSQMNPAFCGNTYAPLFHLNSRVQWPSIDLAYNTVAVSYDQYFRRVRSGFGLTFLGDNAGNGIFRTLRIEAQYAYSLKLRDQHYIKMGISIAMVQKRLNWEKLVFPDQLNAEFGHVDAQGRPMISDELQPGNLTILYPDLGAGILYYSPYFYAGFAVYHVNNPSEGLMEFGGDEDQGLSNRFSVHIGGQIASGMSYKGKPGYLHPTAYFINQAGLSQINLNLTADIGMIYAGIGYRHVFGNPDAAIFSTGFKSGMYKIGYSYDLTVSRLGSGNGGSHELGVIINLDDTEWFPPPGKYSDCFEIFR